MGIVSIVLALGVAAGGAAMVLRGPDAKTPDPAPALSEAAVGSILAQKVAADARRPFTIKRILPIEGPIRYGEWHWDDKGVPQGPLIITVDLKARVLSVFRDGYEIGAAAVMLGTDDHPTPVGTFPILSKERHNVSEQYGNAPMPWTLRLTPDGIAIHGGNAVQNGYASHGCVAVPDALAAKLFEAVQVGDRVVITKDKQIDLGDNALTT